MDRDCLLEQLAGNAWPALTTQAADGWLLRHTAGVASRRLNSARTPLAGTEAAAFSEVEPSLRGFYAERRADRLVVQVTPAERQAQLDAELGARGYDRGGAVDVLVAPIDRLTALPVTPAWPVMIERVTPAWTRTLLRVSAHSGREALFEHVLSRIAPPSACFAVSTPEGLSAVALAVAERRWLGLFCMVTAARWRRRGHALALLGTTARWGRARHCDGAYLQVEEANLAAQRLCRTVGFERSHGYHYRVTSL